MSATLLVPGAASAGVAASPRRRRRARFVAAVTFAFAGLWLAAPLEAVLLVELGASPATVGAFGATVWGAALLAAPLMPVLAARLGGPMALHRAAAVLAAASFGLLPFVGDTLPAWFLLGAISGFASSLAWISADAMALSQAEPGKEGRWLGVYQTFVSAAIGAGPLMLLLFGARVEAFWAASGLLALGLLTGAGLGEPVGEGGRPRRAPRLRRALVLLSALPAALVAAVAAGGLEASAGTVLPVQALEFGLSPTAAAMVVTATGLGNLGAQIPAGWLADRIGAGLAALACAALVAVAALAWPAAAGTAAGWAALAVLGGAGGALYTLGMVHAAARFAGPGQPVAMAGLNIGYLGGGMLGAPAAGALLAAAPAALPWAMAAFVLAVGLGVARRMG
jgi:MFS family permease